MKINEVYPYYMGNGSKIPEEKPGISIDVLRLVEAELGLTIRFVRLPWNRCKSDLKKGKVDGIFNASYKKGRLELGYYPTINGSHTASPAPEKRLTTLRYMFYTKADSPLKWDGKTFKGNDHPVGAILGYSIVSDLKKLGIPTQEYKTARKMLSLLQNDRLSAIADLETKIDKLINRNSDRYGDIVKVEVPIKTKHYYLMLSKQLVEKDRALADRVWNTIEQIRNSAAYADIENKY